MQDKKQINPPAGEGSNTSRTQLYHKPRLAEALAKRAVKFSRSAKQRLKWMEHFEKYRSARLTCRHFGISPDTFYLWRKRFDPNNLKTLEDDLKTRSPHRVRKPKYTLSHIANIKKLKEVNPKLGKTNISRILKETGITLSPSTVNRIISAFKKYGRI